MLVWPLPLIDAILAFVLSLWVLWNVFKNLKSAVAVFLQAVPEGLVVDSIIAAVKEKFPSVMTLHHLHLLTIDGEKHILAAHVVVQESLPKESVAELKVGIKNILKSQFAIVQIAYILVVFFGLLQAVVLTAARVAEARAPRSPAPMATVNQPINVLGVK